MSSCSGLDAATGAGSHGASTPFVDPALPAPDAPICWMGCPAAPVLDALAWRPDEDADAVISVAELSAGGHIILGPAGEEYVLLRDPSRP